MISQDAQLIIDSLAAHKWNRENIDAKGVYVMPTISEPCDNIDQDDETGWKGCCGGSCCDGGLVWGHCSVLPGSDRGAESGTDTVRRNATKMDTLAKTLKTREFLESDRMRQHATAIDMSHTSLGRQGHATVCFHL
jgi:hypothetical protein